MVDVVALVLHKYVDAPLAVNIVEFPKQIAVDVTATVGNALTVIVPTAVLLHPVVAVPVTVYDVFVVGVTDIVDVVAPVFHEYVDAPLAANTAVFPVHTDADVATMVGKLVTEIVPTAVLLQPAAVVPVTE